MTRKPLPVLPAPLTQRHDLFAELEGGLWLAKRLGLHGVLLPPGVFDGVTESAERETRLKELLRRAVLDRGLECVICGRDPNTGKGNTYAQAFERLYGESLDGKPTRRREHA